MPTLRFRGLVYPARAIAGLVLSLCVTVMHPSTASATNWIVPDEFPTIQAALDYLANSPASETVLVRGGLPPERLLVTRGITIKGIPPEDGPYVMPQIDRLLTTAGLECSGLRFAGPVILENSAESIEISFESCQLDSGLSYRPAYFGTEAITMTRCTLSGITAIYAFNGRIDSCIVRGPLILRTEDWGQVRGNRFEDIPGTAVTMFARHSHVARNVVQGCASGIKVVHDTEDGTHLIEDNQVEDCAGTGIDVYSYDYSVNIFRNRVARCAGDGIVATGQVVVRDNDVLDCDRAGILITQQSVGAVAEGNVVGRCGGEGMRLTNHEPSDRWAVRNNTVYACAGSGVIVSDDRGTVSGNIGYGNGGYGLSWSGPTAPAIACNDWFGNTAGAVNGDPGATDLAVDPQFCDVAANDVHLLDKSPLVNAPGCGQIGALGTGCAQTATLVTRFDAERVAEGIQLTWRVSDPDAEIHLERAERASGPWTVITSERSHHGDLVVELDRDARSDRSYWYRLVSVIAGRPEAIGVPLEVGGSAAMAFALQRLSPNPGAGLVRVEFELAHQAPITLDVYDVQGRAVAALARGEWPAGRHTVEWSGATPAGRVAPGLYLVRYRFPGGHHDSRVVRSR